jgi:hypothetical protein
MGANLNRSAPFSSKCCQLAMVLLIVAYRQSLEKKNQVRFLHAGEILEF